VACPAFDRKGDDHTTEHDRIWCKRPHEKEDLLGGVVDLSFGGGYAELSRLLILGAPFCVCQLLSVTLLDMVSLPS